MNNISTEILLDFDPIKALKFPYSEETVWEEIKKEIQTDMNMGIGIISELCQHLSYEYFGGRLYDKLLDFFKTDITVDQLKPYITLHLSNIALSPESRWDKSFYKIPMTISLYQLYSDFLKGCDTQ